MSSYLHFRTSGGEDVDAMAVEADGERALHQGIPQRFMLVRGKVRELHQVVQGRWQLPLFVVAAGLTALLPAALMAAPLTIGAKAASPSRLPARWSVTARPISTSGGQSGGVRTIVCAQREDCAFDLPTGTWSIHAEADAYWVPERVAIVRPTGAVIDLPFFPTGQLAGTFVAGGDKPPTALAMTKDMVRKVIDVRYRT